MIRDSVVFYKSFYEAISTLQPDEKLKAIEYMMEYALYGREPEGNTAAYGMFLMARPQIDANNRKYENGKKGGKPSGDNRDVTKAKPKHNQEITKTEPKRNQTETKPKPNEKEKENVKEKEKDNNTFAPDDDETSPCAGRFQLNDGTYYEVTENDVETFQQLYPGIDVRQEFRNIEGWCMANPKNRKTRSGAKRFINGWMSRAQNRARSVPADKKPKNGFHNFEQRDYDYDELMKRLNEGG